MKLLPEVPGCSERTLCSACSSSNQVIHSNDRRPPHAFHPSRARSRTVERQASLGTCEPVGSSEDHVKRVVRTVSGFTLLAAGALMILLPGPGWVTIALGLALLAPHFPWAQRALDRIKETGKRGADLSRSWLGRLRRRFD